MNDLETLMVHIATVWDCNPQRYPALQGMNAEERRNFLLKHSLLHIGKTAGKVAAVCENFDHNGKNEDGDERVLQVAAVKMFVNALKLAEETGLSAADLLKAAPNYVN